MFNENPNEHPKTVKELEKVVEEITKSNEAVDIDINEMLEKFKSRTELEKVIEEKCVRVITTVICESDVIGVNSGRYWVEGVVSRVSRYGIAIMNPTKEFLIRLGKINVVVIHQRGKIYEKYKDAIDKFFKNI